MEEKKAAIKKGIKKSKPPPGVHDYDAEQMDDLGSVAMYAMDIFNYLKTREVGSLVCCTFKSRSS